ncbi:MAG TPA: hypothetical protein VFH59_16050 [Frateuria sp.]|uniref:hypothetical protein n=1 Tax=Frateuria sp. TaxID=2211372 RepID=UPI002D7FE93E|nr:hypothetical protein [Frateuria sp.]HET6806947.1 hypothetical protein [Frateuria sp.]
MKRTTWAAAYSGNSAVTAGCEFGNIHPVFAVSLTGLHDPAGKKDREMTMFWLGRMFLALLGGALLAACSYGHHARPMFGM